VFTISKRFGFAASHVLTDLPDGHPCARLHGHNYRVELVLAAEHLDDTGFVVEYGRLEPFRHFLNECLDHRHLNDLLATQPSAEQLAGWLHAWCAANLEADLVRHLVAVLVSETDATWAEYRP